VEIEVVILIQLEQVI